MHSAFPRRLRPRMLLLASTMLLAPQAFGTAAAQGLPPPGAGPQGGRVVAGAAGIAQGQGLTRVTQGSDRAVLEWQQFNVGSQHRVEFQQPSAQSWTLNRVTGGDPSVIAGQIRANGGIAIVNQSGVVFAEGSQVNVGSLIASAANITNQNFMQNRMAFDAGAPRRGAKVENRGDITVAQGGMAALVGPEVANSGTIRARLGRVALAGGAEAYTLDLAGDGLLSIDVTQAVRQAPAGGAALVTNSGTVGAAGGSVLLTARDASGLVETLVSHTGRISAPTVAATATAPERTGTVALRAEGGNTRVAGSIAATGARSGRRGGTVEVNATGTVTLAQGASVDVSGAAGGGRATIGAGIESRRGQPARLAARTVIEPGATVRADATERGNGGEIIVHSAERTEQRGLISARGGPQGGDGGAVEVSGQDRILVAGRIDVDAPAGTPGSVLIDPNEARIVTTAVSNTDPFDIEASVIEGTTGTFTVSANSIIRVNAAVNKTTTGGLTLTTTNASGGTIILAADVTLSAGAFTATSAGTLFQNGGTTLSASGGISITAGGISLAGTMTTPAASGGAIQLVANGLLSDSAANFGGILALGRIAGDALVRLRSVSSYVATGPDSWLAANSAHLPSATGAVQPTVACNLVLGCGSVDAGTQLLLQSPAREIANGGVLRGGLGLTTNDRNAISIIAGTDIFNSGSVSAFGGGNPANPNAPFSALFVRASHSIENTGVMQGVGLAGVASSGMVRLDTTLLDSTLVAPTANPTGAGILNSGTLTATGRMLVTAQTTVTNTAGASIIGEGTNFANTFNIVQVTGGGDITNAGTISADGGGAVLGTNSFYAATIVMSGGQISNSGSILGLSTTQPTNGGGVYVDTTGVPSVGSPPIFTTGTAINNSGTIQADHFVGVSARGAFTQTATGSITGGLVTPTTVRSSTVTSVGAFLNQGTIESTGGTTTATALTLRAQATLTNSGTVRTIAPTPGGTPTPDSARLRVDTTGAANAGDPPTFTTGDTITNSGQLLADGRINVSSMTGVVNSGTIAGGAVLQNAATPTVRLIAFHTASNTGTVNNTGTVSTALGGLQLQGPDGVVAAGALSAPGTIAISASTGGGVALTAPVAAATVTIDAAGAAITQAASGAGLSAGTLTLVGSSATLTGAGNAISALGASTLTGALSLTTSGPFSVTGATSATSVNLSVGSGAVTLGADVTATAGSFVAGTPGTFFQDGGTTLSASGGVTVTAGGISLAGTITSPAAILLTANGAATDAAANFGGILVLGKIAGDAAVTLNANVTAGAGYIGIGSSAWRAAHPTRLVSATGALEPTVACSLLDCGTLTAGTVAKLRSNLETAVGGTLSAGTVAPVNNDNVVLIRAGTSITNDGTISGTGGGDPLNNGLGINALFLQANGSIENTGSILGLRTAANNSGMIRLDTTLNPLTPSTPTTNPGGGGILNSGIINSDARTSISAQTVAENTATGTIAAFGLGLPGTLTSASVFGAGGVINAGLIQGEGVGGVSGSSVTVSTIIVSGGALTNSGTILGRTTGGSTTGGGIFLDTTGVVSSGSSALFTTGTNIVNSGNIHADYHVIATARGSFSQLTGGTVRGGLANEVTARNAVRVNAGGSISNAGLISARGGDATASGLFLQARGDITNGGTVEALRGAAAESGRLRLDTAFATNTTDAPNNPGGGGILNTGTIAADRRMDLTTQAGLTNALGASITARGLPATSGGTAPTNSGLFINAGGDLTNAGSITGAGGGGTNSAGNTSAAVAIVSGGALSNSGSITSQVTAASVLSGGLYLDTRGFPLGNTASPPIYTTGTTIANSGAITAGFFASVNARTGFTQTATGTLRGGTTTPTTNRTAVTVTSGATFLNQGLIEGTGGDGSNAAVVLRAQSTLTNEGTLHGIAPVTGGVPNANSGALRVDTTGGTFVGDPPTFTTGDTITNTATGQMQADGRLYITSLTGIVNAGTVSGGALTPASSGQTVRLLALHSAASTGTVNNTGSVSTGLGDLLVDAPDGVTATGTLSAPGTVTVTSSLAGIAVTGPISGTTVALSGSGGDIVQTAGAAITAGTLTVDASGAALLSAGTNSVDAFGGGTVGGAFALANGTTLFLNAPLSASAVTLTLGAALALHADVTTTGGSFTATTPGKVVQNGGTMVDAAGGITITAGGMALAGLLTSSGTIQLSANGLASDGAANFGGILVLGKVAGSGQVLLSANSTAASGYVGIGPASWLSANPARLPSAAGAQQGGVACTLADCGTVEGGVLVRIRSNLETAIGGSVTGGGIAPIPTENAVSVRAGTDFFNDGTITATGGGGLTSQGVNVAAAVLRAAGSIENTGTIHGIRTATANSGVLRLDTTLSDTVSAPTVNPGGGGITNSGSIFSDSRSNLTAQAVVTNTATGSIIGTGLGLASTSSAAQVVGFGGVSNAGIIRGDGGGGSSGGAIVAASFVLSGGTLQNTGSIIGRSLGGLATSGGVGLDTTGSPNPATSPLVTTGTVINNSGTLSADGYLSLTARTDIVNQTAGSMGSGLANLVTGRNATYLSAGGSISNAGIILGTGGDSGSSAVFVQARGSITNNGSIEAHRTSVEESGRLRLDTAFASDTIVAPNNPGGGGILNAGTLQGDRAAYLTAQTSVTNTAIGTILGLGLGTTAGGTARLGNAVLVNAGGDFVNDGFLRGNGGGGPSTGGGTLAAVFGMSGGFITNTGTIIAGATVASTASGGLYLDTRGIPNSATTTPVYTTGTTITNTGTIVADHYADLRAQTGFSQTAAGSIQGGVVNPTTARAAVLVTSGAAFLNAGTITGTGGDAANSAVVLRSATSLLNAGAVQARATFAGGTPNAGSGGLRVDTTGGTNVGDPPTFPNGDTITNTGQFLADGRLSVTALTAILNSGTIAGGAVLPNGANPTVRLLAGTEVHNTGPASTTLGDMLVRGQTGVTAAGNLTAPGTLTIAAPGGGIALTDMVSAATVNLSAGAGDITQPLSGAPIVAGTLTVAASGLARLQGADNQVGILGASTVGDLLFLTTSGPLTLAGPVGAGAVHVTVLSGGPDTRLTITGEVSSTGLIDLRTPGLMLQDGTANVHAQGDVRLEGGGIALAGTVASAGVVRIRAHALGNDAANNYGGVLALGRITADDSVQISSDFGYIVTGSASWLAAHPGLAPKADLSTQPAVACSGLDCGNIGAGSQIFLNADGQQAVNGGILDAGGANPPGGNAVGIFAEQGIVNDGLIRGTGTGVGETVVLQMNQTPGSIVNSGTIIAFGNGTDGGNIRLDTASLASAMNPSNNPGGGSITNSGSLSAQGSIVITSAAGITNLAAGRIEAEGRVQFVSFQPGYGVLMTAPGDIANAGLIRGAGGGFDTGSGTSTAVAITSGGLLTNSGSIQGFAIAGQAGSGDVLLDTTGFIPGANTRLFTTGTNIVNTGTVAAERTIRATSEGLFNNAASGLVLGGLGTTPPAGPAIDILANGIFLNDGGRMEATGGTAAEPAALIRSRVSVTNNGGIIAHAVAGTPDSGGGIRLDTTGAAVPGGAATFPAGSMIVNTDALLADGAIVLTARTGILNTGAITAGVTVPPAGTPMLRLLAGTTVQNDGTATTLQGDALVSGPSGVTLGGISAPGTATVIASAGPIALSGQGNAGILDLRAQGDITQPASGGGILCCVVQLSTPGDALLGGVDNHLTGLGASNVGGTLRLRTTGALSLTGSTTAGILDLGVGTNLSIDGDITAPGGLSLAAPFVLLQGAASHISAVGNIDLTAGGIALAGSIVTPGTVTLLANGAWTSAAANFGGVLLFGNIEANGITVTSAQGYVANGSTAWFAGNPGHVPSAGGATLPAGVCIAPSCGILDSGDPVVISAGREVANGGTILGVANTVPGAIAVDIRAGTDIFNDGFVSGRGGGGAGPGGLTNPGTLLYANRSIYNTGTAEALAHVAANSGILRVTTTQRLPALTLGDVDGQDIVNSGLLRGERAAFLSAQRDLTNAAGGVIRGEGIGPSSASPTLTSSATQVFAGGNVTNAGTIEGTGGGGGITGGGTSAAVLVMSGGALDNTGAITGHGIAGFGLSGGVVVDTTGASPNPGQPPLLTTGTTIDNRGAIAADNFVTVTARSRFVQGFGGSIRGGLATPTGTLPVRVTSGGDLHNSGLIEGSGGNDTTEAVLLRADGTMTNSGTVRAIAPGSGGAPLPGSGGLWLDTTGAAIPGGAPSFANGGSITNAGALQADGRLSITALTGIGGDGSIAAGALLDNGALPTLRLLAGTFVHNAGSAVTGLGDLLVRGPTGIESGRLTGPGTVTLVSTAGPVALTGPTTSAELWLQAQGDITQPATGAAITTGTLTALSSSGSVRLPDPGNSISLLLEGSSAGDFVLSGGTLILGGPLAAGGNVSLNATGGILLTDFVEAETLTVRAAALGFDGASLLLGRGALFSAPGAMLFNAPLTVQPRDAARLPALVFDGRATGGLIEVPGFVQPDTPGLAPSAQPTQIGAFGTSTGGFAGPLALSLDAGASPVFLLADASAITGTLTAGRVGVLGRNGSAAVTGTLGGLSGAAAAGLAVVTLPPGDPGLASYTFNGASFSAGLPAPSSPPPTSSPAVQEPLPILVIIAVVPVSVPTTIVDTASSAGGDVPGTGGAGFVALLPNALPAPPDPLEAATARAQDGADSASSRHAFTRRFVPTNPPVRTRPQQGRLSDPDILLPDAGGEDF